MEERLKRLEQVLKVIKTQESEGDDAFPVLYALIKREYQLEGGEKAERKFGSYIENLWITIHNQVGEYKAEKKRGLRKGAPSQLRDFIRNFRRDVEDELDTCLKLGNDANNILN